MHFLRQVLWLSCVVASTEAKLRYVRRQSPSPSPTPTPTPGCSPSPAPALARTGACEGGRQTFALQIQDCKTSLDGQFFKAVVSWADKYFQTPLPPDQQFQGSLYTSLQKCNGHAADDCGGVVPKDPTLFYLDDKHNLYVDPSSTLGVNGSWILGKRLSFLPVQSGHGVDVMTPPQFFAPGAANETASHATGVECAIASGSNDFSCSVNQKPKLTGTLAMSAPLAAKLRGYNINFGGTDLLWQSNCRNKKVCGHWTIKAVPACT